MLYPFELLGHVWISRYSADLGTVWIRMFLSTCPLYFVLHWDKIKTNKMEIRSPTDIDLARFTISCTWKLVYSSPDKRNTYSCEPQRMVNKNEWQWRQAEYTRKKLAEVFAYLISKNLSVHTSHQEKKDGKNGNRIISGKNFVSTEFNQETYLRTVEGEILVPMAGFLVKIEFWWEDIRAEAIRMWGLPELGALGSLRTIFEPSSTPVWCWNTGIPNALLLLDNLQFCLVWGTK